jgi:membrane protein DedA with SNARE-associated domain
MSVELLSLEYIQEIAREYGYWAVFGGIALENTGIPLPGETITIVGGFLAGSGELNYWYVLGSTIAGAVLGDNFGYWLGKLGGWPLLTRIGKIFKIDPSHLEKARQEFSKNAAKAVFFGRFVAILRIFAGPMAGIAQMSYPRFLLCNFGGATIWALIVVSLAFFLGKLIPLISLLKLISQFGLIALIIVIAWIIIPIWWSKRNQSLLPKE